MQTLRRLREARGWSKAELSRRAGLNQVTVGQIENGRLQPYHSQLEKLASALGCTVQDLAGESQEVDRSPVACAT